MLEVLVVAHAFLWLALLARYLLSGQNSVYHPLTIYHAFHGLVFVARPILVHFAGFEAVLTYMRYPLEEYDFIRALAISDLGLIVFQEVMLFVTRGYRPVGRPTVQLLRDAQSAYIKMAWLLAPIATYALSRSGTAYEGGIRDEATGIFINTTSIGYLTEAPAMLITILIVGVVITRFSRASLLFCAGYLAYHLIYAQHRWPMMVVSIALFMSYHFYHGRLRATRMGLIAVLILAPAFYLKGLDRGYFLDLLAGERSENVANVQVKGTTFAEKYDGMDFANYDYLAMYGAAWPKESGSFTFFTQWSQLFTEGIPRVLWRDKPVGAPIKINDFNLLDVANSVGITMSMVGAGWISLGYFGVVITAAVSAYVFSRLFRWFCLKGKNFVVAVSYFLIISISAQYYRDGDISIFRFMLFLGMPLAVWIGIYRMTSSGNVTLLQAIRKPVQRGETSGPARRGAVGAARDPGRTRRALPGRP